MDFARQEPAYNHNRIFPTGMEFVERFNWPGNVYLLYNALGQAACRSICSDLTNQGRDYVMANAPRKNGSELLWLHTNGMLIHPGVGLLGHFHEKR